MDAKELMIGNLIKIDNIIVTVDARTIFDFDWDKRGKEPIQLTEEWLLKFGFESDKITFWLSDYLLVQIGLFKDNAFISLFSGSLDKQLCEIKYVHQLQNLYFALTGQELTPKL